MSTASVLTHHLEAIGAGDVDAILADYTEESVLFTPTGVLHGLAELRELFTAFTTVLLPPGSAFTLQQQLIDGESAYIVWAADSPSTRFLMGTDTLWIHDDKILTQSFAALMEPKG